MSRRWRRCLLLLAAPLAVVGCGAPDDWAAMGSGVAGKADDHPLTPAGEIAINTEIKFFVAPAEQTRAHQALDLAEHDPLEREIAFYDTRDLELYAAGLILRTRDTRGEPDDSTVKLRPLDPTAVDRELFELEGFKCEEDRAGTRSVVSCSFTAEQGEHEIEDVAAGDRAIDKLFSRAQEDFARQYVTDEVAELLHEDEGWDTLEVLGPVSVRRWKLKPADLGQALEHKLTVEQWTLPEEKVILELSIKLSRAEADDGEQALRAFVTSLGLDPDTPPATKTRLALRAFSSGLSSEP